MEWTTSDTTLAGGGAQDARPEYRLSACCEGDSFTGILTQKDFTTRATAEGLNPTTATVSQIMTSGVTYCDENDSIEDALNTMRQRHIHHLPVRNQSNVVVGIVTLSDLALKGPQELYPGIAKLGIPKCSSSQTSSARLAN